MNMPCTHGACGTRACTQVADSWARPRDDPERPRHLMWHRLAFAHGVAPPPRAFHASALHSSSLFVVGGEAPLPSPSATAPSLPSAALWRLELTTLQWTAFHALGGGGPHPAISGSALLVASLSPKMSGWDATDSHKDDSGGNRDSREGGYGSSVSGKIVDGNRTDSSLQLFVVGGQRQAREQQAAEHSNSHIGLALWSYAIGHICDAKSPSDVRATTAPLGRSAPAGGCTAIGEQCDGSSGKCVCADGGLQPCDARRRPQRGGGRLIEADALGEIARAWMVVGVSLVTAHLGAMAPGLWRKMKLSTVSQSAGGAK